MKALGRHQTGMLALVLLAACFQVRASGSIEGHIVDLGTGLPLEGARVQLGKIVIGTFSVGFMPEPIEPNITDAEGNYRFDDLSPGPMYAVLAYKTLYERRLHNNHNCRPASPEQSNSYCYFPPLSGNITVQEGKKIVLPPINLAPAARLSGRFLNAETQAPVEGATIHGGQFPTIWSGQDGLYDIDHIALGDHRLIADADGYVGTDIGDVPCGWYTNCDGTVAPEYNMHYSQLYTHDWSMIPGAKIVVNATSMGQPLSDSSGLIRRVDYPNQPSGSGIDIPPGQYTVRFSWPERFFPEMYDDISCSTDDCEGTVGDVININVGETRILNVDLAPYASISGTVVDVEDEAVVEHAEVRLRQWRTFGGQPTRITIEARETDSNGVFLFPGVPYGHSYDLDVTTLHTYVDVQYPATLCFPEPACPPGNGDPFWPAGFFQIYSGSHVSDVEFRLEKGGTIRGTVNANKQPIEGIALITAREGGWRREFPIVAGEFASDGKLPAGAYYVAAQSEVAGEYFDNVPCPWGVWSCDRSDATIIPVQGGQVVSGIDFDLPMVSDPIFYAGFEY